MFFLIALLHCGLFAASDRVNGQAQRVKVVNEMMRNTSGHETIVNVNCGRGYWATEIASRLIQTSEGGGRVIGVDSWGSDMTPYDQQWIIFNSVCEGVEDRIEVGGSWDLYSLPFKTAEHDMVFTGWLPWYDEVGAERVIGEMLRVTRIGGSVVIVLPKYFNNCVEEILDDMGILDIEVHNINTGSYLSHQLFIGHKCAMSVTKRHGRSYSGSGSGTKGDAPGARGYNGDQVPSWLSQTLCWLTGASLWVAHLAWMWCFWDELKVPAHVSPEGQMGASFVANNTTWLGLVLVEIHLEMTMRPTYVLKKYGWINSWALIAMHQCMTCFLWNLGCWLPGLAVELILDVNKEWIWITLSIPCIFGVMQIEEMLLHRRMRLFISAFTEDGEPRLTSDAAERKAAKGQADPESWDAFPSPLASMLKTSPREVGPALDVACNSNSLSETGRSQEEDQNEDALTPLL